MAKGKNVCGKDAYGENTRSLIKRDKKGESCTRPNLTEKKASFAVYLSECLHCLIMSPTSSAMSFNGQGTGHMGIVCLCPLTYARVYLYSLVISSLNVKDKNITTQF